MEPKDDIALDDKISLEISTLPINTENEPCSEDELNEIYPNAEVRMIKAQYSLDHLKKLVEVRKDLVIDPDYQRGEVWNPRQKMELIESILMGIPLPIIYLFEMKDGKKQVVDGRQRISAIIDFMNDKYQLKDLKILRDFNNCYFSDFPPKTQGIFEDFQLFFYIIQPPTAERIKYDIFDRVNRGGSRLNNQEMRNALYQGPATKIISEICELDEFKRATDNGISRMRMRDRYAALRVLAFYLLFSRPSIMPSNSSPIEYKSDIDDFLAKVMIAINENSDTSQRDAWKQSISESFSQISEILGSNAFRFESNRGSRRPINMPLMEILTFLFLLNWDKSNHDKIRSKINSLKKEMDEKGMFRTRVDSAISVKNRFQLMIDTAASLDPTFIPYTL